MLVYRLKKKWCLSLLLLAILSCDFCQAKVDNEFGFDLEKAHISDLHTYWNFASLYYNRLFTDSQVGLKANHSNKFNASANQYQLEGRKKLNNYLQIVANAALAKKNQIQYPNLQYLVEAYLNNQDSLEISLANAGRKYSMFSNQKIFTYSATVGKYYKDYFFWYKLNNYSVQGEILHELNIRKYFADQFSYVTLRLNFGKVPDIGDLPPLDQIVLPRQRGGGIDAQFQLTKIALLRLGLFYTRQIYPNTLIRKTLDGTIGLLFRI